jgi:hypothetical protein
MLGGDDAETLEAPQVHPLDVVGRGLQDDLELQVLAQAEGILAVTAVRRPARGLDVRAAPGLGSQHLQERRRVHRPRSHGHVVRLLD